MEKRGILSRTLCILVILQICATGASARPKTPMEARNVVLGWLRLDSQPLGAALGTQVRQVVSYPNSYEPVYYIVYLESGGFVIVPADDMVEPIIGFAEKGVYDPSFDNPLGALVSRDLADRVSTARRIQAMRASGIVLESQEALESQNKWEQLIGPEGNGLFTMGMGLPSVSDPRVNPLLKTKWGQTTCCEDPCLACYNYFTPSPPPPPWRPNDGNNYPCGCVATAMAQVIRYHEYPFGQGIGINTCSIYVNGNQQDVNTRGGDGQGGAYNWDLMENEPDCETNDINRQAIGALCYDAGVTVNMDYKPTAASGSGAFLAQAEYALEHYFFYASAVYKFVNKPNRISAFDLINMINPNLDYNHPVLISFSPPDSNIPAEYGHAVVADGYGYNAGNMYHHLNMGWRGVFDAWYNFYTDMPDDYNAVNCCVYNIFRWGWGELISGRVTDAGTGIEGVIVKTVDSNGIIHQAFTDDRGIYVLAQIPSSTTYTITATKAGYHFSPHSQTITNSISSNSGTIGNVWGVDFSAFGPNTIYVDASATGSNNGSSWANAYRHFQDALTAAISGKTIVVAAGTYKPDTNTAVPNGTGNRNATFQLKNGVDLFGGFPTGGCNYWTDRNPDIYQTILSGDLAGNDVNVNDPCDLLTDPCRAENSYHVVIGSNTDANTTLDGFTITAGNANSGVWPSDYGGGMFNLNANCTINTCKFVENSSGIGGAMWNGQSDLLSVSNCIFFRNAARDGGGGIMIYDSNFPRLVNCVFTSNKGFGAGNNGGGLYNMNQSHPKVVNCLFRNNSAQYGGGVSSIYGSFPTITNCTFSNNLATGACGGINDYNNSSPIIDNCILWGNTAPQISDFCSCAATVNYSDIQGGWTGAGIGNINADPCFVDANGPDNIIGTLDDNLRLLPVSPCIDKGNNLSVPPDTLDLDSDADTLEQTPLDLDNRSRFIDGDCNNTTIVDMGAYEFAYAYLGDFDGQCDVDFVDFAILVSYWQQNASLVDIAPPPIGDDIVDTKDLAVLCEHWLEGTAP